MSDPIALVLAFVYVSIILALSEILRRKLNISVDLTRKFVHIGVGMIAFVLVELFHDWWWAIIAPIVFIGVNYLSYRRQLFAGMETGAKHQLGTVYFPISFSLLIPLLWSQPALLVASLMPMTWGDAFAAIIGMRFGAHPYTVFGQTRSLEGTATMFGLSLIAVLLTLVVFGYAFGPSLIIALSVACVAAIIEALSPFGIDNLTVPLISAILLMLLNGIVAK